MRMTTAQPESDDEAGETERDEETRDQTRFLRHLPAVTQRLVAALFCQSVVPRRCILNRDCARSASCIHHACVLESVDGGTVQTSLGELHHGSV